MFDVITNTFIGMGIVFIALIIQFDILSLTLATNPDCSAQAVYCWSAH